MFGSHAAGRASDIDLAVVGPRARLQAHKLDILMLAEVRRVFAVARARAAYSRSQFSVRRCATRLNSRGLALTSVRSNASAAINRSLGQISAPC